MKKSKKVTHLLMASLFLVLASCQEQPKKEEHREEPREQVKPPKQIISIEESKSLYDNYTRNRVEIIDQFEMERSPEKDFEAARFSSFDYATIKQYIAFIEQEADSAQVDISSLRFYFANYPDKEKFPDGKEIVHPRQNSIFIVPTIAIDGQDFGFYIGADGKAKLIKDAKGAQEVGANHEATKKSYAGFAPNFAAKPMQGGGQSLNLNRGSSSPPPPGDF